VLSVHPQGGSGDFWDSFNAAGAGTVRVRIISNLVDARMRMDCREAGLAGGLYFPPCRPGDTATLAYGGALNDLDLTVTDSSGVLSHWPVGTLFTLVIAADNVDLPAIASAPFVTTGPFSLTLVTPDGQFYSGTGTFEATFAPDSSDPTRWTATEVLYRLQAPPAAPLPRKPHRAR
jgi:hypothetical protein